MITIKDGRIWFYSEDINSELPTLDFSLISAYICPECKHILSAYFVGTINEMILDHYWKNTSRKYQVGTIKGGSYILQTNHGEDSYQGKNCIYKAAPGRGIENSLKALCGLGSLCNTEILNSFVKAIETGETKDLGLSIVTDMCQADAPMLLYNIGKIHNGKYEYEYEKEEHLGEEIKNLMESHYKSTHSSARTERWASDSLVGGSNPSECVLPECTRLGGKKKKIRLARTQATLF